MEGVGDEECAVVSGELEDPNKVVRRISRGDDDAGAVA